MSDDEDRWKNWGRSLRAEGVAISIPLVMIVFPLVGGLIGKYLADKLELPWILFVGLVLGLVAGIREAVSLIKRLNQIQR